MGRLGKIQIVFQEVSSAVGDEHEYVPTDDLKGINGCLFIGEGGELFVDGLLSVFGESESKFLNLVLLEDFLGFD